MAHLPGSAGPAAKTAVQPASRATGTPFRRFSPVIGWPESRGGRLGIPVEPGPLKLGFPGRRAIQDAEPMGSFGGRRLPRGMAIGEGGRLFLADPAGGVIRSAYAAECTGGADVLRPLWPRRTDPDDPWTLRRPTDVAILPGGDLAIADPDGGRVLILAWPTAAIRAELRLPGWAPTALGVDHKGRLLVADPAGGRLVRFGADHRPEPGWPHPSLALVAPEFIAVSARSTMAAPEDCGCGCHGTGACGADETVFVIDQGAIIAIDRHGRRTDRLPEALLPPALVRDGTRLLWHDPCLPGRGPLVIPALPFGRDGRLSGTDLPLIALSRRVEVPRSGFLIFDGIDSGKRGFAWDRIVLDLALPAAASVTLRTLTTEAEIAPDRIKAEPDSAWSRPLSLALGDLPEVLVQSGPGRYLWLWLDLLSDGTQGPQISRIDVFGPRRSGLRHLPAPFHQDPESRDFLDRFLSVFDTIFAELRQAGSDTAMLFDPEAVPEGAWLDWLGSWFDLNFLAEWDVPTRRAMVASAIDSARLRGTRAGLQQILRWHLGLSAPWPMVIEHFRLGPGAPPVGMEPLPQAAEPHRMTLVLPRARVPDVAEARLMRLIEAWAPAHVAVTLRLIEPGIVIGCQSLLGVDTLLQGSCPEPPGFGRAGLNLATAPALPRAPISFSRSIGARHV
jgi:phage tail-like protein